MASPQPPLAGAPGRARRYGSALALLLALCGCGSYTYTAPPEPSTSAAASGGPITVSDPGDVTGTITGPCHIGHTQAGYPLPDPACTPGAYDPKITAAVLCNPDYTTRTYRPSSGETARFKYDVAYPAYGIDRGTQTELDHLINLDLGGANDGTNLWPEPGPIPNPKDATERHLHDWVCEVPGQQAEIRLHDAQVAIATDWTTAESVLGVSQ